MRNTAERKVINMRAGFGRAEITPPLGVELAGFGYYLGRKCESVRDPLYARAVLIEDGKEKMLLVSCDVLGLSRRIADRILEEAEELGISRDHVLIVSVHTHTGPAVIYHLGCGETDEDYLSALGDRILPALRQAAEDLAEVSRLRFVRTPLEGDYFYNRAAPEGPVDRDARGFLMERTGRAPILIGSAACHGVFLGRATCVSADFSGAFHRLCGEAGILSLYLNGLCGDIDPLRPSEQRMEEFGRLLFETLREPERELPRTLEGGRLPWTLRLRRFTREEIRGQAEAAVRKYGSAEEPAARAALQWEKEMLLREDTLQAEEPGDAAYCVLGGIPILALPFEGFTETGRIFRRLIGMEDALVLGCAEELLGYLPTRDEYDRDSYAARESFFLYRRLPPLIGEAERMGEQMAEQLALRKAGR